MFNAVRTVERMGGAITMAAVPSRIGCHETSSVKKNCLRRNSAEQGRPSLPSKHVGTRLRDVQELFDTNLVDSPEREAMRR